VAHLRRVAAATETMDGAVVASMATASRHGRGGGGRIREIEGSATRPERRGRGGSGGGGGQRSGAWHRGVGGEERKRSGRGKRLHRSPCAGRPRPLGFAVLACPHFEKCSGAFTDLAHATDQMLLVAWAKMTRHYYWRVSKILGQ
jgi:hypothetical protein